MLAVDPSSQISGGSILGDKTRMEELTKSPKAYVRPSATRGTLGGVTRNTYDAILLCEHAGYNIILVETVGVGQSETAVEQLTDMFVLLSNPAGGDDLQGIKKGIMELVDLIVINKADGDLIPSAKKAKADFNTAIQLLPRKHPRNIWVPEVKLCSSAKKTNIDEVWSVMAKYWNTMKKSGDLDIFRGRQRHHFMWKIIHEELIHK